MLKQITTTDGEYRVRASGPSGPHHPRPWVIERKANGWDGRWIIVERGNGWKHGERRLQVKATVFGLVNGSLSRGHIGFEDMIDTGTAEVFRTDARRIYRAPITNPLDANGYRLGARFVATAGQFEQYPHLRRRVYCNGRDRRIG